MRNRGGGLGKKAGGRLANKVSTINGVGECKAFILATVACYCLQNNRFSNAVYLGKYWYTTQIGEMFTLQGWQTSTPVGLPGVTGEDLQRNGW